MVERAIPDAWTFASPSDVLEVRSAAAGSVLRRVLPEVDDLASRSLPLLNRVIEAATFEGRPLAAANRAVDAGDDPAAALWQATTTLREHRGDGHVAVLTAAGLDGCQVHVLMAAYRQVPAERLQKARGWTDEDWAVATDALVERGWLHADGSLTEAGRTAREDIERRTDELALPPFARLGDDAERLADLLAPLRDAVLAADVISFPNPIGLPATHA
jgi:helix-turn-helix protein